MGLSDWCRVCGTAHGARARCPGALTPCRPERAGTLLRVDTAAGARDYGILLAPVGAGWRARVRTFPNVLWSVPGGGCSMKFLGGTEEEAEHRALAFVRAHCARRGFRVRDESKPGAAPPEPPPPADGVDRSRRCRRVLPVRFGTSRPTRMARTGNLSGSGLFVATDQPLDEGCLVGLLLELEHCKVPLRGNVVWRRRDGAGPRPAGMGLRLLDPPPIYVSYVKALFCQQPAAR